MAKKETVDVIRKVTLRGIRDIMFDRYPGDNKTKLEPHQKLYVSDEDGKTVGLPAANISSFLGAVNSESCAKRFIGKGWRTVASSLQGFCMIEPMFIPFRFDGKTVQLKPLAENGAAAVKAGNPLYQFRAVPRLPKGIPNPTTRAVLRSPWELSFEIRIFPGSEVTEQMVLNLLEKGGLAIGLGSYRGVFGKFVVDKWDVA